MRHSDTKRSTRQADPWGHLPKGRGATQPCFECATPTAGRHHVVPVAKGGTKQLPLCEVCHALIHDQGGLEHSALIRLGLAKARQAGWQPGRPRKVTPKQTAMARELHAAGRSYRSIASEVDLSVGTVHKIINDPA